MYNSSGKGVLRIIAVDPSALNSAPQPQPVVAPPNPAPPEPIVSPSPAPPSPEDAARRERERANHLEKAVAAAKRQLDDAAQFIKEDPQNPKLLDYVDRIAALNAAVGQDDPDDIERKMADLSAALVNDKDYQQFAVALDKRRSEAAAQHLSDAIQLAREQHDFLVDHVSKNPLAPEVATLMPLIKQIGPALERPSLDQLQPLTDQIGNAIREANLHDAFRNWRAPTPVVPVNPTLPTTEKNRFLLEGDLADVVALYNAGAKAPHVALNLRGEFDFADDRANVCLFGLNPDGVALTIRSMLAPYHLKAVTGLDQPCDPQRLDVYDVVAMQRGAFLKSTQIDALSLIKQIEIGAMRKFALVSAADQAAASAAERAAVEQISTDVAAGAKNGFGVILLKTGSPNLCGVVTDKVEAQKLLILKNADKLTFDMRLAPVLVVESAEDAFGGAQKAQCGAIYASAADLKTISEGLTRAAIPFAFSSLWITLSELDAKDAEVVEKHRLEAQQAAERARKAAEEARLVTLRAEDQAARQSVQQATLRAQYDGSAKAAVAAIVAEVTSWGENQRGAVGVEYPDYAAWLAEMKADHWEIMSTNSNVQDYGTSDFKGRPLDTAFARVTIRLKNAILGEYKDACFVFGRIADPEFNTTREPLVASCGDEGAIKLWQTGHGFQSRWIVGEQPTVSSPSAPTISGSSSPSPPPTTPGAPPKSEARSAAPAPAEQQKSQNAPPAHDLTTIPEGELPGDVNLKPKDDTPEAAALAAPVPSAKAPVGEALPTIWNLPQYKFAREVEHSPVTGGSAESQYLTTVYGMIRAHLHETAELHLEMASQRGVVDFYVDEGGALVGRKLVSSSGSPNLDVAVMEAIAAAGPYPAPPNWQPVSLAYNFGRR